MLTIYLVRHGKTENNQKSITMGQIDTPLTQEGLKNAGVLAEKLKWINFDYIFSSDLGRAFITAYIIADKLNLEKKLFSANELREINYGIFANRKKDEVKEECPKYKKDALYIFPEGESYYQVQVRVVKFIEHLERAHKNQKLLIVTHSGVIRAINCFFQKLNLQENLKVKLSHEYIGKLVIDNNELISYDELNH
jgi:phosphoserine phosphatase